MSEREPIDESAALYVSWDELRRRLSPTMGRDRFRAFIKTKQERAGFPPFQQDWDGFYFPRVREWLDSENGAGANVAVTSAEDGPENFDAAPRSRARPQARSTQPALLDRKPGHAGSDGIPRRLHPIAGGRDR